MRTSMTTDDYNELGVDYRAWEDTADWLTDGQKCLSIQTLAAHYARQCVHIFAQVGDAAMTNVMTPLNPRWWEFNERLSTAIHEEGCDGFSFRLAKRLMGRMAGIDVAKSVSFFERHDCYSDGEVLLYAEQ